jgi:hypothetical protein
MRLGAGIFLGCRQAAANADPLAGFNFAVRLQTHNGDGVPLGLYQDISCTTPATQDFDTIAAWRDELSESGVTLTQEDPDKQPILRILTGVPAVEFDGIDDVLEGAITGIGNALTTCVAGQSAESWDSAFCDLSSDGLTNFCSAMFIASGSNIFRVNTSDASFSHNNAWHVFTGVHEFTQRSIYVDGALQTTNADDITMTNTPTTMRVGLLFQDFYSLNGNLAAVMHLPATLGASDRELVEAYQAGLIQPLL